MADVNLKINGLPVTVPQGTTILEAANTAGIKIPTLCFLKGINEIGACRVCVVEVKGARSLGSFLRLSRQRRNGSIYQYREGKIIEKNYARTPALNSRPQLSFLFEKPKL